MANNMSEIKQLVEEFNQANPDPCWKSPGHEMRKWAEEMEAEGRYTHGMGPLDQPCKITSEYCPACGKQKGYL